MRRRPGMGAEKAVPPVPEVPSRSERVKTVPDPHLSPVPRPVPPADRPLFRLAHSRKRRPVPGTPPVPKSPPLTCKVPAVPPVPGSQGQCPGVPAEMEENHGNW
jgi:hypothetical protein